MKKTIALLLCLAMALSLCACGGEEKPTKTEPTASTAAEPTAAAATAEPTPTPEPTPIPGTPVTSAFWSLHYPDGWALDEKGVEYGDKYARATVGLPASDGNGFDSSIYISVYLQDPGNFRDDIKRAGFDLYDVIANGNIGHTALGGVDCIDYPGSYYGDDAHFFRARVENANATVTVRVLGDIADQSVQFVLRSLQFTLEDQGNVDPPYSWDGTPFRAESADVMVGTRTLHAEPIPFAESLLVDDIFSGRIGTVNGQLWVLLDEKLSAYDMGSTLTRAAEVPLEHGYEDLSVVTGDTLCLSRSGSPLVFLKDGQIVANYGGARSVAMHPDGEWGLEYFTGNEVTKLTFRDGVISKEKLVLEDLKSISSITICTDCVLIGGNAAGDGADQMLAVYDYDLKLVRSMRDQDTDPNGPRYLGAITHAYHTENGYLALDGNMREIYLWTHEGAYIGNANATALFGTRYPWLSAAFREADGSILVGLTNEREDRSADEFLLYRVTGF